MSIVSVYCKWLLCLLWVSIGLGCFVCLFVSLAFYCVFTQKCRNVEKPLVLLCFRSQMLKKHLFCCVFGVLGSENIEFIVILLVFCSTSCVFNENPCAKMQKKQKSEKKHLFFQRKIFRMYKTISKFWFWWKSPNELKTAKGNISRPAIKSLHALCLFLCSPLFEPKWEPLRSTFC